MEYRIASLEDLEIVWNKDIEKHKGDERWVRWKGEYINYNKTNALKTFVAVTETGDVIAQISLVLLDSVKAVAGKPKLCNNKDIANFNAFRCDKQYRGQGHISKLVKLAEVYAKEKGIKIITIGAEACMPQNLSIYFHFGYTNFVMYELDEEENNELILYYSKNI